MTGVVGAYAAGDDGFSVVQVLTVVVVLAVGTPLLTRIRRAVSSRRLARWAAEESSPAADRASRGRED